MELNSTETAADLKLEGRHYSPEFPIARDWLIDSRNLPENAGEKLSECVFSNFNGYFGCRASLPFAPRGTRGTYVNGLYAHGPADLYWVPQPGQQWDTELFPTLESICAHGREWALTAAPNIFSTTAVHAQTGAMRRTLDMKSAVVHLDGDVELEGKPWRIQCIRFALKDTPDCALERIILVPADESFAAEILVGIDGSIVNIRAGGKTFDLWGTREHVDVDDCCVAWRGLTRKKGMELGIAMKCVLTHGTGSLRRSPARDGFIAAGRGTLVIDRYVALCSSRLHEQPLDAALAACARLSRASFEAHRASHAALWQGIWDRADIVLDGPLADQQALRYNIYQVMCAMLDTHRISIGLNSLSDEGYHGLVFWDADLYILPVITRTFPEKAKNHLLFRHAGLETARRKARRYGLSGAMYPWEAAPTGEEGISPWILLNRTQVHVVGAVAWALVDYVKWTGDEEFMQSRGWEILAETARFWVSKTDPDGQIRFVCGPDEFNQNVDNNAYTNRLAKLNLLWAARYCRGKVTEAEIAQWTETAQRIVQKEPDAEGVIEQFDGFFAHPEQQTGKQADVIAMPFVDPDALSDEQLAANYHYYIARCKHLSSLSEPAYAIAACRLGMLDEAYRLFRIAADIDLRDMHQCTEFTGHHAACSALVGRVVMEGFCGMKMVGGALRFSARLPIEWKSVEFRVVYKGAIHRVRLSDGETAAICPQDATR